MKNLIIALVVAVLGLAMMALPARADVTAARTDRLGIDPTLDFQIAPLTAPSTAQR